MDEAELAFGGFIIAGCQSSGVLELVEAAFHHIAQGVDCGIDRQLNQAVALGRDNRGATALFHIFANEIRIIASICQQHFWLWSICCNHEVIAFVIGNFPATDFSGYGKSDGICPEMNFGRKATF